MNWTQFLPGEEQTNIKTYGLLGKMVIFLHLLFNFRPSLSSRWWLDRPGAGWLRAAGDHERHGWANLRYLPGSNILPSGWDPLGLRVSPRCLPVSLRKICGRFRLLRQSGQNQNTTPLQAGAPSEPAITGVPSPWRQGEWVGPREDATGGELQGGREGARKGAHQR